MITFLHSMQFSLRLEQETLNQQVKFSHEKI